MFDFSTVDFVSKLSVRRLPLLSLIRMLVFNITITFLTLSDTRRTKGKIRRTRSGSIWYFGVTAFVSFWRLEFNQIGWVGIYLRLYTLGFMKGFLRYDRLVLNGR